MSVDNSENGPTNGLPRTEASNITTWTGIVPGESTSGNADESRDQLLGNDNSNSGDMKRRPVSKGKRVQIAGIQPDHLDDDDETDEFVRVSSGGGTANDSSGPRDVDIVIHPRDKFWLVYLAFYFLGITTLLPWNFFINADKYWMYKFRQVGNGSGPEVGQNATNANLLSSPHGKTPFQASFTSYLAIASNVPSTICFVINVLIAKWISAKKRMISSLLITFLFFVAQTALVEVDTDNWQGTFFIVTMVGVVLMNSFCTFFQSSLFSTLGKFPAPYTTACMSGQALGGIFAAVANILSLLMAANQTKSALIYFSLGSASLLTSFLIVTLILPKVIFYKYYSGERGIYRWVENYPPEALLQPSNDQPKGLKTHWTIFKKVWVQTLSAGMTFVVTLAGFPTLIVLVVSEDVPSVWNDVYYVPVVSFLVFGIGDYLGRILSGFTRWPGKDSYLTLIFSILRLSLIPMIMACNLHPRKGKLPVLFPTDLEFGAINYMFGFTNGYLCNLVFTNAPQLVHKHEQEEANGIVTMGLGIGLTLGVTLSYLVLMVL